MGAEGTELKLICLENISDEVAYSIQRIQYTAPTVELIMLEGYAYIRISSFTANTYTEFDYAVRQAQNEGAKALVFDVRGNAGGLFRTAYDMIDQLCPLGTIAKRENRTGTIQVVATSDEGAVDLPMVVLVNESTSAAAELFAVSVRDIADGQVVGMRTVGRNAMLSSPNRLADGSAVVVTVATLWTGRDETFEGGVIPNVLAESDSITEELLLKPDPMIDMQIQRALEVARAMVRERGGNPNPAPAPSVSEPLLPPASQGDESGAGDGEAEESSVSQDALDD
jgi:carboxyl-terminal processing protease